MRIGAEEEGVRAATEAEKNKAKGEARKEKDIHASSSEEVGNEDRGWVSEAERKKNVDEATGRTCVQA